MVKDPDFDELAEDDPSWGTPEAKLAQWQDDFNRAERLAGDGRGFEAFDLDSFVDYLLLYNIVLNSEIGHPKSLYLHKERLGDDCLWKFGPTWDFDASFNLMEGTGDGYRLRPHDGTIWLNAMFEKLVATPGFIERYKERFARFESDIYPRLLDFVDEYARAPLRRSQRLALDCRRRDGVVQGRQLAWPRHPRLGPSPMDRRPRRPPLGPRRRRPHPLTRPHEPILLQLAHIAPIPL